MNKFGKVRDKAKWKRCFENKKEIIKDMGRKKEGGGEENRNERRGMAGKKKVKMRARRKERIKS